MVGKVSSFITQGVYSVATPFHPFGGAVDIIAVQQQDGSFRSTPWYVRFGKFQGVLKGAEKVVRIEVNGVEANFHMYLDNSGEAYFVREVSDKDDTDGVLQHANSFKGTREENGSNEIDNDNDKKDDGLSRLESYDSSTGEFQLRDEHVALGVDRLERTESDVERPFYDFQDVESSFEGSAELSEYGSSRYENLDVEHVIESQNLSSEVVLVSVDGHILTAPISSTERNTEDVELNTSQIHLGPGEGVPFSEDSTGLRNGESALAADYLTDTDTSRCSVYSADFSNVSNENSAFQRQLEVCAGDGKDFNQAEGTHDSILEKELLVDSSLENTSAFVAGDVFKSCLELTQLARQDTNSGQDVKGSPVQILEVAENSEDKSCQRSLPINETEDSGFGKSIDDVVTLSSSGSPRRFAELQAPVETLEKNASDLDISGSDSRIDNFLGPNEEVNKEVDVVSGQQLPASEDEFSTNDSTGQTTLNQEIPACEEAFTSNDDNVEPHTTVLSKDEETASRTSMACL